MRYRSLKRIFASPIPDPPSFSSISHTKPKRNIVTCCQSSSGTGPDIPREYSCGQNSLLPMHRRLADRTNTRRRCLVLVFAAIVALAHAGTTTDEDAGAVAVSASSGATMSVFDTLGVLGNIGWWSLDQIMETAGYGERHGLASTAIHLSRLACCTWCAPSCVVKSKLTNWLS